MRLDVVGGFVPIASFTIYMNFTLSLSFAVDFPFPSPSPRCHIYYSSRGNLEFIALQFNKNHFSGYAA